MRSRGLTITSAPYPAIALSLLVALAALVALVGGCVGLLGDGGDEGQGGGAGGPGGASSAKGTSSGADGDDSPVIGASAGGQTHVISDGWSTAPVRYGDNVKMLSYVQMQAEVARATGVVWSGWANSRAVFGGADFVTTYADDRTPSGTKLVTWRKMAFDVCARMLTTEASTPSLFSAVSPTAAIRADDAKVAAQVRLVFTRFFLEDPTAADVDASIKALGDTVAAGGSAEDAWTGLCVGYLSSMRFLTY